MENVQEKASKANELDYKITKRHYPRTNNDGVLEFLFEKDPNLFLRKNKIAIRGTIQIPPTYIVDTSFASKLFSQVTVEIESQAISNNRVRLVFIYFKS